MRGDGGAESPESKTGVKRSYRPLMARLEEKAEARAKRPDGRSAGPLAGLLFRQQTSVKRRSERKSTKQSRYFSSSRGFDGTRSARVAVTAIRARVAGRNMRRRVREE